MKSHRFICTLISLLLLLVCATTALATQEDQWDPTIPSSAKSYSAGTCHYGFTTSNYISKPSAGFGSSVSVSSEYVYWDDEWDYDFYELVKPKDQNGNYMASGWTRVYTGLSSSNQCYSIISISPASSATKLYLRIENPGYTISEVNFITDSVIGNMKCKGKFWL